ncbi:hypothetical protein TcasGA2_TC000017 [Tribolium castaneum]|uniref:Uncharacterized protein n=1 Tax=Tribolium castaneum TaxID=7070 RepID=D7EL73_TRICA|nr:hypothetical protein TcasGA2_TC000017 [Tribolium castaneum]
MRYLNAALEDINVDRTFPDFLLRIGEGKVTKATIPEVHYGVPDDLIEIPNQYLVNSLDELLRHVFEDIDVTEIDDNRVASRAILCPKTGELSNYRNGRTFTRNVVFRNVVANNTQPHTMQHNPDEPLQPIIPQIYDEWNDDFDWNTLPEFEDNFLGNPLPIITSIQPFYTDSQLRRRVSTMEKPGTFGLNIKQTTTHIQISSDDDKDSL